MGNPYNAHLDNRPLVIGGGYNASGKVILKSQGVLAEGTVLGIITASQKLKVCGIGNGDGSETAAYVLTKEVDASGGADITAVEVLKAGVVNGDKLIFSGVETLASVVAATGKTHDENLRSNGIITLTGSDLELYDNT